MPQTLGLARLIARICAVVQILLGLIGLLGIVLWLTDSNTNPESYQLLALPYMTFLWSLPFLGVTAFIYRQQNMSMSLREKSLIYIGCLLPLLTIVCSLAFDILF
jgi:hypothetical protein